MSSRYQLPVGMQNGAQSSVAFTLPDPAQGEQTAQRGLDWDAVVASVFDQQQRPLVNSRGFSMPDQQSQASQTGQEQGAEDEDGNEAEEEEEEEAAAEPSVGRQQYEILEPLDDGDDEEAESDVLMARELIYHSVKVVPSIQSVVSTKLYATPGSNNGVSEVVLIVKHQTGPSKHGDSNVAQSHETRFFMGGIDKGVLPLVMDALEMAARLAISERTLTVGMLPDQIPDLYEDEILDEADAIGSISSSKFE
ncbi:hypothetical protein ml_451 [Mollivirus sibericum]|uniref:hypothetical protein n=1 Tax=Mollivirus sibericum TaxID=1678078 RepID=UPI0006B2D9CC|nr:hypothetical protein ml_451 [Mollivirus sibericum]ALD62253.1 hypothetical protein ml_451 [Mollivirus sibericum]